MGCRIFEKKLIAPLWIETARSDFANQICYYYTRELDTISYRLASPIYLTYAVENFFGEYMLTLQNRNGGAVSVYGGSSAGTIEKYVPTLKVHRPAEGGKMG